MMFGRTYSAAMRNGSRLLFAISLVLFAAGLVQSFRIIGATRLQPLGPDNQLQWGWLEIVGAILSAVSYAVTPLIGALIVDRIDRWLGQADRKTD